MRSVAVLCARSPMAPLSRRDLSAGQVWALACAAMVTATVLSIGLEGNLGWFFGVCFVLVAVTAALAADVRSLYAPGVLPPLLLIAVLTVVALFAPDAIEAPGLSQTAGVAQRIIAGVVDHATALVTGHLLALGTIAYRIATAHD